MDSNDRLYDLLFTVLFLLVGWITGDIGGRLVEWWWYR